MLFLTSTFYDLVFEFITGKNGSLTLTRSELTPTLLAGFFTSFSSFNSASKNFIYIIGLLCTIYGEIIVLIGFVDAAGTYDRLVFIVVVL